MRICPSMKGEDFHHPSSSRRSCVNKVACAAVVNCRWFHYDYGFSGIEYDCKWINCLHRYLQIILCLAVRTWYTSISSRGNPWSSTSDSNISEWCSFKISCCSYKSFSNFIFTSISFNTSSLFGPLTLCWTAGCAISLGLSMVANSWRENVVYFDYNAQNKFLQQSAMQHSEKKDSDD